ncbi:DUF4174 domain-containing protein [Pseudomonas fragi]|uniref:Tyrosyl-trna synthetase n=1 Tax=Pseudomonas fragi TaxID=296 RepID=A0A267AIN6_PSEFR|nr:DUF4174 domain-containing protein [Pseudomonas fragi]PAA12505.1 tyrosyl-trna synthetase [Pseudomonas fragi]
MFIRLLILATVLVAGTVQAVEVPNPLEQDRGKLRPLVIVARADADPTLVNLKKALEEPANKQAFEQRNMVLYTIVGITGKRDGKDLEPQSTMSLIRGLKPGMIIDKAKVILIGKDGEKKVETVGDVDLAELFKTIDALPVAEQQTQAPVAVEPPAKGVAAGKSVKPAKPAKAVQALDD